MFKFIVKAEDVTKVTDLFEDGFITFKESAQGRYQSVTVTVLMKSSDEVIAKYEQAAIIPGVMSF